VKAGRGFTFVEMIVVLAVIGLALALTVPMGSRWISDYRFSATSRAMVNAANLVRMNAIGGPITINITQIAQGGTSTEFALTAATNIVYTTPPYSGAFGFPGGVTDAKLFFPIQENDYVTLVGFRSPDYVNGVLFRVSSPPTYGTPTQVVGTTTQWTMPSFSFKCKSCSELNPMDCIQWPTGLGAVTSVTGKVQVAAALKISPILTKVAPFEAITDPSAKIDVSYSIEKSGNSVNLRYWRGDGTTSNRGAYTIRVNGTEVTAGSVRPIVFDFAGATRGHVEYKVEIFKIKNDGTVNFNRDRPVIFSILPSGRIRLGAG